MKIKQRAAHTLTILVRAVFGVRQVYFVAAGGSSTKESKFFILQKKINEQILKIMNYIILEVLVSNKFDELKKEKICLF